MNKELLKEVKELLESGELTREQLLLELFTDYWGDLDLGGLDLSDFGGNLILSSMKVKNNLYQEGQIVGGSLFQGNQYVKGDLLQGIQYVEGNYISTNIVVKGGVMFEEPILKKITIIKGD